MSLFIALIGAASMLASLWRRQWIDAVLVLVATAALAGLAADLGLPVTAPATVATIAGDGLRGAEWDDLPARPMRWTPPPSTSPTPS